MRKISTKKIIAAVSQLCIESNCRTNEDIISLLRKTRRREEGKAKRVISSILENIEIAAREKIPICQDTGMVVVFLEIGNKLEIDLGQRYLSLDSVIQEGVREGYKKGYLRKSVVDPLSRINTGDNTPAIIREKIVSGTELKIRVLIKGFGAENMAKTKMLSPNAKEEEIKKFVFDSVREASSNPCPPVIVGIGIGGTMQKAASLAEEALLENFKNRTRFEKELLTEINKLNIGPAGLGGKTTALAVKIKTFPTHIAGLPVAVNISCWANRHKEITL